MIDAPLAAVWTAISQFGAAAPYLVGVVDCTMEGDGIGARRTLKNVDNSTIVECLVALDEVNHQLSYVLLTDTPFRNCLTTLSVSGVGQGQAEVTWWMTFEVDGLPINEAIALLEGASEENCLALKQFMETSQKSPI